MILALGLFCAFQVGEGSCDQKALKDKAKKLLEPYKYDLAKVTRIVYKDKPTMKEIEVPLFIGEKYRLVFNTEALPKNVVINCYNRDKESTKRKLMFSSKDAGADKKEFSFEYSFANKIFIDYDIPPGDSTASGGCLVFMLGYK
jgi:hypothetical protein